MGPVIDRITPLHWPAGGQVQFSAIVRGDSPLEYAWDFGQWGTPAKSAEASPLVQLGEIGDYQVKLTVTNAAGRTSYSNTFHATGYTVSGSVTGYGGEPAPNVTLYFSNGLSPLDTDLNGNWARNDVGPGTYTITPEHPGWAFAPESREFTVDDSDLTGVDMTFVGMQRTEQQWTRCWSGADVGSAIDVAAASDGSVFTLGYRGDLLKYSADGELIWAKKIYLNGAPPQVMVDAGIGMEMGESDQLIICCCADYDRDSPKCLLTLDLEGHVLQSVGLTGFEPTAFAVAADNRCYVGGRVKLAGDSSDRCMVAIYDPATGKATGWCMVGHSELANAIAIGPEGDIYLGGSIYQDGKSAFACRIGASGEVRWAACRQQEDDLPQQVVDLGVDDLGAAYLAISVEENRSNGGGRAALLCKYSPDGQALWTQGWPSGTHKANTKPALCIGSELYFTWCEHRTTYQDPQYVDVIRMGFDGVLQAASRFTHAHGIIVNDLALSADGSLLLCGSAANTSGYWEDALLDDYNVSNISQPYELTLEEYLPERVEIEAQLKNTFGIEDSGLPVDLIGIPEDIPGTLLTIKTEL